MLAAGFIKPIQHSHWLSNIVQVKKKNVQIRCCVDFRNLNRMPKGRIPIAKNGFIDRFCSRECHVFIHG